jgi:hypothetical protein
VKSSRLKSLSINHNKTECTVITEQNTTKLCRLSIGDTTIKQVQKFDYLGSIITEDGKFDKDIRRHIGMAKEPFEKLSNIMNNKISMAT